MPVLPIADHVTPEQPAGLHEPCVLLKLGEIVLKGKNRQQFERLLQDNIKRAVRDLGIPLQLRQREGVIVLTLAGGTTPGSATPAGAADGAAAEAAVDLIADRMSTVMGIARICRAVRVAKDPAAAIAAAVELTAGRQGSFRRPGETPRQAVPGRPPPSSPGSSAPGSSRSTATRSTCAAETRRSSSRSISPRCSSSPRGCRARAACRSSMSGRALVLMSGGIDSPVAAYRMMRRGLRCSFLHFSGMPLTGPESVYKAYGLVRELDKFQGGSRLFVVAFGKAQQRLASSGAGRLQIMAQRRLMLKTGEVMARRQRAAALVTGDSLGQVSSQTLTNITALDDAVTMPILRPLIGLDKAEIMAEARRIRTLSISELPDEDCCSLLTPRQVEIRARIEDLRRIEARLDVDDLAEELAAAAQEHTPDRH